MPDRKTGLLPATLNQLQVVNIFFDGQCVSVEPDPVRISVQNQEQLLWILHGDAFLVSIEFRTSPFNGHVAIHPTRKRALSGVITKKEHVNKFFKYSITIVDFNGRKFKLDPDVNVMP